MKPRFAGLALAVLLAGSTSASAAVINFGLNIHNDSPNWADSTASAVAFYDGSDTGDELGTFGCFFCSDSALAFGVSTLPGPGGSWAGVTIDSIDFFVDASDVGSSDVFTLSLRNGGAWQGVGTLSSSDGTNYIPLITGGRTTAAGSDNDNTFFWAALGGLFADEIADGTFAFQIARTSGNARIDGVNLQVNYTRNASVPEPSSMMLLGSGLLGFVAFMRRKR